MESAMGRITFYITLEDYEKLRLGQVVECKLSPKTVVQMRIAPQDNWREKSIDAD